MLTVQVSNYDLSLLPDNECRSVDKEFKLLLLEEGCTLTNLVEQDTIHIDVVSCVDPIYFFHGKILKTVIIKQEYKFIKVANEVKMNIILRGANHILASTPESCRYFEVPGSVETRIYFAMDQAQGDLAHHVKNKDFQPKYEVFQKTEHMRLFKILLWMNQLLKGLIEMHARNVLHNDLKMENVLLKNPFEAFIADFGESRHLQRNTKGQLIYKSMEVVGTEPYFSKDHAVYVADPLSKNADGEIEEYIYLTDKTDVYVMGLVFFRILNPNEKMNFKQEVLNELEKIDKKMNGNKPLILFISRPDRMKAEYIYQVVKKAYDTQTDQIYRQLNELIHKMTEPAPYARLNAVQAFELFKKIARDIIDTYTDSAGTGDKISSNAFVQQLIKDQKDNYIGNPDGYIEFFMNSPEVLLYIIKSSSIRGDIIFQHLSSRSDVHEKIFNLNKLITNNFVLSVDSDFESLYEPKEPEEIEEVEEAQELDDDIREIRNMDKLQAVELAGGVKKNNFVAGSDRRVRMLI